MSCLPDGTVYYGRIGEIRYDAVEDKVQCHLCGGWLHQIGGSHLLRKHRWTIVEYRETFQIPKRIPTCGEGVSTQRRHQLRERIVMGGDMAAMAGRFARDRSSARTGARAASATRISATARKPFLAHRPELKSEWHPTRNRDVSAEALGLTSKTVVWWRCSSCGYAWAATVMSRASAGTGCPACFGENSRRRVALINERRLQERGPSRSLAVINPRLAAEIHPTRNQGVDLTLLLAGSGKRMWWLCPTCGHEWQARIGNRSQGGGCPVCARRRVRS